MTSFFNWIDLYEADKERYDDPKNYTSGVAGNPETDNVENYYLLLWIFHFRLDWLE